ncbi:hypothetical protein MASR2M18_15580 [Ignavibacteria bacterium]|nr:T9SS type A sorting domain-containing protein [Bacteroidota bacterium]MCZ2132113.1 T9SS type A sorting domain-containing protein [Bacteroidota bacterium]
MKFATACIASALAMFSAASAGETVSVGKGYANDVFYHIEGRAKSGNAPNADWDIAFETSGQSGAILVSGGNAVSGMVGAVLWDTELKGMDSYKTIIDTNTLFTTKQPLANSAETWHSGAFNMGKNPMTGDLGWGLYNPTTHKIEGSAVFVVKLPDSKVRKVFMDGLDGDDFTFRYANIDGSDEQVKTFKRSEYAKKNFVYFSMHSGEFIDREPESADWHIVFGKYLAVLEDQGNASYAVVGVRTNNGVKTAKYKGADPANATANGLTFTDNIAEIGHDWKVFAGTNYTVASDAAYFVQTPDAKIFKVIFTKFEGSSTGNIEFTVDDALTSVHEEAAGAAAILSVFPNPTAGAATVAFDVQTDSELALTDALGRIVRKERVSGGFNALDLNGLPQGAYMITLQSGASRISSPLIVR